MMAYFTLFWAWLLRLFGFNSTPSASVTPSGQQQQQQHQIVRLPSELIPVSTREKGAAIGKAVLASVVKHGKEVTPATVLKDLVDNPEVEWFTQLAIRDPNILLLLLRLTSLKLRLPYSCEVALFADLTAEQVEGISSTFSNCLRNRKMAGAGYAQWRGQHAAIQDLTDQHPFLKYTVVAIGQHVILVSPWGASFRIYSGAGISVLDMISDIFMIIDYIGNGLISGAAFLLCCIAFNITIQIIFVTAQNKKLGKVRIAKEAVYVILFIKPAVDAARVISGQSQEMGTVVDPLVEMMIIKICEAVTEAIPSSILQFYFVLKTGKASYLSMFSVSLSFASIAFSSTSIAFDLDCSPGSRASNPEFYVSKLK
jgi:hypothetical protein